VRDCGSVAEIQEVVRRYAAERPDADWILGSSYDPALAPGGIFEAAWLDAVVADRPVMLEASDHHCAWVNTEAMRRCGITAQTPDPPSSRIPRHADGTPIGTLVEWNAVELVKRHLAPPTERERRRGLLAAGELLASAGVTWVQEAAAGPADAATYLGAAGDLPMRVNLALRAEPDDWRTQLDDFLEVRARADGSVVSARTVKFFADGIIEAGTAAVLVPYVDAPHSCGLPVWEPAELAEAVAAVDAAGFQAHIHAIGDAGVRAALDACAHAREANGPRDRRPVIAHTQLIDPADLRRFADLGVIANFEPLWHCAEPGLTDLVLPRIGDRTVLHYATGSVTRSGARMSFGSDWPVSSMRPLDGLSVAVTRQTPDGQPAEGWLPEERVSAEEAFKAYTSGVAYQAFEEQSWGRIAVGLRADLVALAEDPFATEPLEWPQVAVTGTWLGGRRTYG
jgi:predicted amidohydrolase YtcJ